MRASAVVIGGMAARARFTWRDTEAGQRVAKSAGTRDKRTGTYRAELDSAHAYQCAGASVRLPLSGAVASQAAGERRHYLLIISFHMFFFAW